MLIAIICMAIFAAFLEMAYRAMRGAYVVPEDWEI